MGTLWQDVRYGVRMLWKSPGFTAIALVTLAVGIGANTVMFTISDTLLLLRARKVKNLEQLAYCAIQGVDDSAFRYSEYLALRDSGVAFSDVMARVTMHDRGTLVRGGSAWRVWANYVSANFFSVLGAAPIHGRGFLPEEERHGSTPVVVLSYRCWQRLGGDPKVIGELVNINGTGCQVVGVAPKGFTGVTLEAWDIWLPLGSLRTVHKAFRSRPDREPSVHVVGRLKPGVTMPVARAQLQNLVPLFRQQRPEHWPERSSINLRPPGRWRISEVRGENRRFHATVSLVLVLPSAIILLIACLNLANMLIVQGASRQREIAVRMALGSGRWRIIRQLLAESALLAVWGGILGILLALWGIRILGIWFASVPDPTNNSVPLGLNVRVLVATLALCLIATVLFGLKPALLLSRRDISSEMKASGGSVLGALRRRRSGLSVAGQIALAVALVLSATLLTRSALEIARPDPRFPLGDKVIIQIDPVAAGYDKVRSVQVCEAVADRLASVPEVESVGTSGSVFFGGGGFLVIGEYLPGAGQSGSDRPLARKAALVGVGRDYFKAMEIPLLRGRVFNPLDSVPDAEKVAIIDESLARQLRPDGNALDCLIQWGVFSKADSDPFRVVGIVAHLPGIEDREVHPQMYTPIEANTWASCLCLHVANKGPGGFVEQRISKVIGQVDPRLPILSIATLAEKRNDDSSVWLAQFGARLGLAAGAAALFLAGLGIYAIKGYMVASRTAEIGIRMALGATGGSIVGMVLREGLVLTAVGLIIGLGMGLAVAKVAARFLYGVSPIDPVSIVVSVALLGAASMLASYVPARRAAQVDPMVALRAE